MSAATVAVVAVGVAASAAAAAAKKRAAGKAADARSKALDGLEELDIPGINVEAAKADEASYAGRLDLQKRVDPLSAQAREVGLKALTENVETEGDKQSQRFIEQVAAEQADPALDALRTKLLATAQSALDSGATMTPEFQAELVRTGLETGGAAGLAPDRQGASGQTLRRVTGAAGEALINSRVGRANEALGGAQSISNTRANILGNLVSQIAQVQNNKTVRAANAFTAGSSQTPTAFGLTGADVAGMNIANVNMRNQKTLGKGAVEAGRALAQGEFISSLIGAAGSAAGGLNTSFAKV